MSGFSCRILLWALMLGLFRTKRLAALLVLLSEERLPQANCRLFDLCATSSKIRNVN
jgi:hypothetical protein